MLRSESSPTPYLLRSSWKHIILRGVRIEPFIYVNTNYPELLAETLHTGGTSLALDDDHWRKEIRHLFNIALARLQITLVDLAWGRYFSQAGYRRMFIDATFSKQACVSVKIRVPGWRNINLVEFLSFSVFLAMLWISTTKYEEHVLPVWFYRLLVDPFARQLDGAIRTGLWGSGMVMKDVVRLNLWSTLYFYCKKLMEMGRWKWDGGNGTVEMGR